MNYKNLFEFDNEVIYLNCATMSPLLRSVKEAGIKALGRRAKPWNLVSQDWFTDAEVLRDKAAQIFQTSPDKIAFIPSASYGLAAAAKNLKVKPGKSIILIENQFPSNYYVWENLSEQLNLKIITIRKDDNKILTESILEKINENTGIVTVPNCHWMDGSLIDLEKVSEAVKAVNAHLVLDLSQSLGAMPVNTDKIDPDFAVAVGYKWMLGPYSLGYMYVSPRWHEKGEPLEYNWSTRHGSEDFTTLTLYTSEYRKGARKFDMGEFSQFNVLPMAIAALNQITEWGAEKIQSYVKGLTEVIVKEIFNNKNLQKPLTPYAGHLIGVSINRKDMDSLKKKLADNKIVVSFRGSSVRISPHLYNDSDDIRRLIDCLY